MLISDIREEKEMRYKKIKEIKCDLAWRCKACLPRPLLFQSPALKPALKNFQNPLVISVMGKKNYCYLDPYLLCFLKY